MVTVTVTHTDFASNGFLASFLTAQSLLCRTVGRNSPTLEISRDTCVFTPGRSRSAVGTATRLFLTLQPVKPTRKLTGEIHRLGLAALLSSIPLMS